MPLYAPLPACIPALRPICLLCAVVVVVLLFLVSSITLVFDRSLSLDSSVLVCSLSKHNTLALDSCVQWGYPTDCVVRLFLRANVHKVLGPVAPIDLCQFATTQSFAFFRSARANAGLLDVGMYAMTTAAQRNEHIEDCNQLK